MSKFKKFILKEIENDIQDLKKGKQINNCKKLNEEIKKRCSNKTDEPDFLLDEKSLPMHFSGDPESRVVFVELNPGKGKGSLKTEINKKGIKLPDFKTHEGNSSVLIENMDSYYNFYKNFGSYKAENLKIKNKKIPSFDRRQLCFFSGFGLFDLHSKNLKFTFDDMIKVRNVKLQLEIVPYSSKKFNFNYFDPTYIEKQMEKIFQIIKFRERDFVFITGNMELIKKMFKKNEKFSDLDFKKKELSNGKTVYLDVLKIENTFYSFISTYKARRFNDEPMFEYGKICKDIINPEN